MSYESRTDALVEFIATVLAAIVLAICYSQCPADSCADAVRRCAVSDGVWCEEVNDRCKGNDL